MILMATGYISIEAFSLITVMKPEVIVRLIWRVKRRILMLMAISVIKARVITTTPHLISRIGYYRVVNGVHLSTTTMVWASEATRL